jgi:hypothetical protein
MVTEWPSAARGWSSIRGHPGPRHSHSTFCKKHFFFLVGLGFELRALHLQSRRYRPSILLWFFLRSGREQFAWVGLKPQSS